MFYFYPWGEKDYTNLFDYQKDLEHIRGVDGLSRYRALDFRPAHIINDDIRSIRNYQPVLFCHDQEPLNFGFYQDDGQGMERFYDEKLKKSSLPISDQNLRSCHLWSWYEKWILLHTELGSPELTKYELTGRYQGAFWWSHALISRDWYRYAEKDRSLEINVADKKLFLIYARDCTGTRAYRATFLESIQDLYPVCQIGSRNQPIPGPDASAIYNSEDFISTEISVVLETLFDDPRIYLTEKILRPLACGHPFILAAGPFSVYFLQNYGFETFSPWIDESYDLESDHDKRMAMIIAEMRRIAALPKDQRDRMMEACREIARRNKQRFFSDEFEKQVIDELTGNISTAYEKIKDRFSVDFFWEIRKWKKKHRVPNPPESRELLVPFLRRCRQNKGLLENYQSHQHRLDDKSHTNGDDVE